MSLPSGGKARDPLRGGGTQPSPPLLTQHQSQVVDDDIKKIPTFIAFFKLFLGDVKLEILLFSWNFLVVFWMYPSPAQSLTGSFFWK